MTKQVERFCPDTLLITMNDIIMMLTLNDGVETAALYKEPYVTQIDQCGV